MSVSDIPTEEAWEERRNAAIVEMAQEILDDPLWAARVVVAAIMAANPTSTPALNDIISNPPKEA